MLMAGHNDDDDDNRINTIIIQILYDLLLTYKLILLGQSGISNDGRATLLLYSHDQLYKHICICMQNHNDTIRRATQFF